MSKTVVINALVLKVTDYAENDRLISLLSVEKGRISVIAKGGRSVKYKCLPAISLFTYSSFELYEKNGIYWIKDALVNTYFPYLCDSLEAISLAAYLADLTYELSDENESGEEMLRLLLNSLYVLSDASKPQNIVKAVFELRSVCLSGYMPDVSECDGCGGAEKELYYFDVMNGRLLCRACFSQNGADKPTHPLSQDMLDSVNSLGERNTYLPVSLGVVNAIRYVLTADPKRIFAFKLDGDDDVYTFSRLAEIYATWHIGRGFTTLDFYKSITK